MNSATAANRLSNRELIAAIRDIIPGRTIRLSNRVRLHPGYEEWNRRSRFVRLGTRVPPEKRSALSRRINNMVWALHGGSVWYACKWDGVILTLSFDHNGD